MIFPSTNSTKKVPTMIHNLFIQMAYCLINMDLFLAVPHVLPKFLCCSTSPTELTFWVGKFNNNKSENHLVGCVEMGKVPVWKWVMFLCGNG